jgi:hypothetical protein
MFSSREAADLRLVNKFMKEKVTKMNWKDMKTVVPIKALDKWKKSFPNASCLNISNAIKSNVKGTWPSSTFKGLERIKCLNVYGTNFKDSTFKFFPQVEILKVGDTHYLHSFSLVPKLLKLMISGHFYTILKSSELQNLMSLHAKNTDLCLEEKDFRFRLGWVSTLRCLLLESTKVTWHLMDGKVKRTPIFPTFFLASFLNLAKLHILGDSRFSEPHLLNIKACHFLHLPFLRHLRLDNFGDMFDSDFFRFMILRKIEVILVNPSPVTVAVGDKVKKEHQIKLGKLQCYC